ncbi:putative zinc finger protein 66 [Pygocentrus nattereri]|uniref:putative zinc finger protein 66 n=1 Tax=Pygocentrus nattereri TaxID=42514 RepID=UPI00189107E0|nr:putative zinc finger protein 66 [Pygocentrus nattereri]
MRNIQALNMLYAISPHLDNQNAESENYFKLTLQINFTASVSLGRTKKGSHLSRSESFPCLQLEKFKEESNKFGELIDEKERLVDRSLVIRMAQQCEDDLPAGLIPPVEIDDEEGDITWAEKSNKCLDKPFKKKGNTAKVKHGASDPRKRYKGKLRKAQKHKSHCCGKASDGRTTLKMQTKEHGEAFRCETCGKDFKRSDLLTDHVKVHKRKRPYPCDECGMMFAKPAYLKIHLRRHAGERTFTCDQCEKRFFDKYDLNVHLRDHTGERPYVCPECGKGFKRIYILNKHKRTHSKEKPFQCNVCGKAYRYVYSYRLHMKDHSA